jgi:hypothetical protein
MPATVRIGINPALPLSKHRGPSLKPSARSIGPGESGRLLENVAPSRLVANRRRVDRLSVASRTETKEARMSDVSEQEKRTAFMVRKSLAQTVLNASNRDFQQPGNGRHQ